MTRLRLLAFVLLLGAAPPGVEPAGTALVGDAKAFLPVSCAASKPTCAQAGALLKGYLEELAKADACGAKACSVAAVQLIFRRDQELDELEHALPHKARAADGKRPLLRLSLLVVGRAGAALALADPKAEATPYWKPEIQAPKMVELICTKYPEKCSEANGLVRTAGVLRANALTCAKRPCDYPQHEAMAISAEAISGDYLVMSSQVDAYTLPIFSLIADARGLIAQNLARLSAAKLGELEKAESDLLTKVSALAKHPGDAPAADFDALNARGAELIGMYQEASVGSDRTLAMLGGNPETGNLRGRVNASAARLASARAQLAMIKAKRGFGGGGGAGGVGTVQTALAESRGGTSVLTVGQPRGAPGKVLLDRRAMPLPLPSDPSAPPIIKKKLSFLDVLANTGSDDDAEMVDAKRRLNLTRTLGDPAGRAKYVHTQKASDTCAVVAQQGVLLAHGLLPKGDPAVQEAALAAEARSRGFYRHGTHDAYTADLLVDRGLIVTKQSKASIETLDAAVRRGGMIIANVDARGLWNVKNPTVLGHAIVITGAEVGRFDDKTLGYYINDSGTAEVGAGRFIPIAQFKLAWNAHTQTFAEVK